MNPIRRNSLARGAILTVAGLGAVVMLAAAAPAMARGGDSFGEKCGAAQDTSWQSIGALAQKLEGEGYTDLLRVVRKDGCYSVIARKDEARPMKLWLNPASLEVTGFSKIPPKHFRGGKGKHGFHGKHDRSDMHDRMGRHDRAGMQGNPSAAAAPEQPSQPKDN